MNMVRLKAKDDAQGTAWDGEWYPVVDGHITVPEAAVAALTSPWHGYTLALDEPVAQPAKVRKLRA